MKPSTPQIDVALISMPFAPIEMPSMGLSLLKGGLNSAEIKSKVFYFGLQFAEIAGIDRYRYKSSGLFLWEDWIFSKALFAENGFSLQKELQERQKYAEEFKQMLGFSKTQINNQLDSTELRNEFATVHWMSKKVLPFMKACLETVVEHHPRIVGFSSVLKQHIACLALAKSIKEVCPEIFIVFGGPNCRGSMGIETLRQFPFIDAVVLGEGDKVFPEMARNVLQNGPLPDLQGVYYRANPIPYDHAGCYPNTSPIKDLDDLPLPDFDDYFEQRNACRMRIPEEPMLTFETSRGCWWGRCRFCAIDPENNIYRSKSGERALKDLECLTKRYNVPYVFMTDNVLDMKHFKDFIPRLAEQKFEASLFYEIKSSLKKEQVRALRDANVMVVLPGIESLSSSVLKLMNKGVTGIQNIQLLKWCKEMGLRVIWFLLWGFPGEAPEEYARMTRLIPLLLHLSPPTIDKFFLMRFSLYYDRADHFGLTHLRPNPAYKYIYPFREQIIAKLAQYFVYDCKYPHNAMGHFKPLWDATLKWQGHGESYLCSFDVGKRLFVWDERPVASNPLTVFTGVQRLLYVECDIAKDISELELSIEKYKGADRKKKAVEQLLEPMIRDGLMILEDNKYLSLAIPAGAYYPPADVRQRFEEYLIRSEERNSHKGFMRRVSITDLSKGKKVSAVEMAKSKQTRFP